MKISLERNVYIFNVFAQNIDCGFMSTHNICFGSKSKTEIGIPLETEGLLYKSGV